MGLIEVFGVMYFTVVCAAQDYVDYEDVTAMFMDRTGTPSPDNSSIYGVTATLSNTFPTSKASTQPKIVYEPPVPSLHLLSPWGDVFPFEKAVFECRVNDSTEWTFTWSRNGHPVQEGDRNVSLISLARAALTITAASQADGGLYDCQAHHKLKGDSLSSNLLELKVYENTPIPALVPDPKLEQMFPGESVTFQCMINVSSGWEYLWYHNDKEIQRCHNNICEIVSLALSDSGQYHCKAKRGGESPFYTEKSKIFNLQVSEPPRPSLKLRTSWSDVFQMESVAMTCDVGSPDWTFTWHRNATELREDPAVVLSLGGVLLNITSASRAHQGLYACKAHLESRRVSSDFSNMESITVYENIPKPSLRKDPVLNSMYIGETITFTCQVHMGSGWLYSWFRDGNELAVADASLRIHLSPHERGTYWCKATRGQRTSTDISERITQDVLAIPLPSLTLSSQWADVFPTESVLMSCAMADGSGWTYMWRRDDEVLSSDDTVYLGPGGANLSIASASASHRGRYSCSGKLPSRSVSSKFTSGVTLRVYDRKPKAKLEQDPEHMVLHTGDPVSYSCRVNVSSGWEYVWYKDDTQLGVSGMNYTIDSLRKTNAGSYKCQAIRVKAIDIFKTEQSRTLKLQVDERPTANIIVLTGWSEVFSTDSLVLTCEVKGSKDVWNYTWFSKGQQLVNSSSDRYTVTPQNDPEQSQYICQGIRSGRPSYSKGSAPLTTRNLLLKRRVLLSISGCIVFGIAAVFFGCLVLRLTRKPADDDEGPEEGELFLTMAQLKDRDDAPCPLVDYVTDVELNAPAKEEVDIIHTEETVTSQDDQAVTTNSSEKHPEVEGSLVSFQH
ncbi:B-cell receptor CD22-like [Syngnathoides biaculeatus]|uniref:B-cell receptor CD22-like n=1 Tax=Syngnathoides biaculeatus TaxID=300417 RepID=UPI002ADD7324|nr:B-cell receptor CD22-like [Syngnathoides biaculeatus]